MKKILLFVLLFIGASFAQTYEVDCSAVAGSYQPLPFGKTFDNGTGQYRAFLCSDSTNGQVQFVAPWLVLSGTISGFTTLRATTSAGSTVATLPANTGTIGELNVTNQTWTSVQNFSNNIGTKRNLVNQGTSYSGADAAIVLSAGWGTTAAVSSAAGQDPDPSFTITSNGTGQSLNPIFTITFKDGAWPTAPLCTATFTGGTSAVVNFIIGSVNTTSISFTALFTPTATQTTNVQVDCRGR